MSSGERKWRWLAAGLGGFLLAAVMAATALLSWLNSEPGRDRIESMANAALRDAGLTLSIEGWSGRLPFGVEAGSVELSDPDGVALRVSDLRVDWQPLPLLWGDIRIDVLEARSLILERWPAVKGDRDSSGPQRSLAVPGFVLDARVNRLAVDRAEVAEAVLGQRAAWQVEGEIGAPGEDGRESHLDVLRIDRPSDRFLVKTRYRHADNTLSLEAIWQEAPDGFFARLMVPESEDGIEVRMSGDGPLDGWHAELSARVAGAVADLSFQLEEGDESRLGIRGDIDAIAVLPDRFETLAKGEVELGVTVRQREKSHVIRVPGFRYRTEALVVSGQGSLDRRDGSVAGRIDVAQTGSAGLGDLLTPLSTDGLSGTVTVAGSLEAPMIEAAIQLDRLDVAGVDAAGVKLKLSVAPSVAGAQTSSPVGIQMQLETREVGWSLKGMEKLIRGPARATLSGEADGIQRVSISSLLVEVPDARVTGTLDLDLEANTLKAPLQVLVTDLDALDALTRLDLEGSATLDVDLSLPGFDGRVDIGVAGITRDFSIGLPVVRSIVSPQMELAASLAISPRSGLRISDIQIVGARASVVGGITFPAGYERMEISAEGRVPDASVLSPELKVDLVGEATARARLSGPARNPGVDGTLAVGGVQLPTGRWTGIQGTYSLADLAEGLHGPVSISGDGPVGPTRLEALLAVGEEATEIREIQASATGISAYGQLRVPHSGDLLAGSIDAIVEDLGPAADGFLGWEGAGRGSVSVAFDAVRGEQRIRLTLDAERLHLVIAPNRPLSADKLSARADVDRSTGVVDAELTVENFSGPSSRLPILKASAQGTPAQVHVEIDTEGRILGAPASVAAGLDIRIGESRTRVTLSRLKGALDGLPIESRKSATLTLAGRRSELGDLDLRLGQGEIKAAARLGVPDAALDATITTLPLVVLRLVNPALSLSGEMDARIDLRAGPAGTEGSVDIDLGGVLPPHRHRTVPMTGSLHGQLISGRFAFEASAATSPQAPVTVTGELPLDIDLVGVRAVLRPDGRLSGRLDWSGDALDILSLLPLEDHLVSGPVSVALNLSGTAADPRVAGRVALEGGRYEHLLAGTLLTPLDVLIEGDGESLRLVRLEAGDGGAGTLTGSGRLTLDPKTGFPLQADLEFENLTMVRRDEITGRATGAIRASGPLGKLEITGKIRTNEVEVGLVNNLPPSVVELEITETESSGSGGGGVQGAGGKETRLVDGTLDVNIAMPSRVYLRGLGLDSEWEGDLNVRGTLGRPQLVGRLESVRGVLMFFGRRFRLESSSLVFTGGRKIDPELNVRSTHEGRELTVHLMLTGPISNPDLSLSSDPPVPEDEILARALFGKSAGQLTAVEAVQLAAAVSELTSRSSGPGVLARLREAVGVDVLRFGSVETAEGEQATTFEAGRYVTEGLYLGVETSTVEEGGGVSVEYEISRRLRITTDIKQTGSQNIGVEYKKDY